MIALAIIFLVSLAALFVMSVIDVLRDTNEWPRWLLVIGIILAGPFALAIAAGELVGNVIRDALDL